MIKNASIATLAMFLSAASPAMATNVAHSLYVNLELALNQTTVGTVIRSISEQTGYEFSYDETLLNKKISKVFVILKMNISKMFCKRYLRIQVSLIRL